MPAAPWRLTYQPRALVLHRHRAAWAEYYRQQRGYGRGHGLLYLRYSISFPGT